MNKFTIYAHNIIIEATEMAINKALKFGVFVRKLTDYEPMKKLRLAANKPRRVL